MNNYEKLEVYHLIKSLVLDIYHVTRQYPKEEIYGLSSQIRRAAISSLSNLVEGTSRSSLKEKKRFIEISYGSLLEVDVQIVLSECLTYCSQQELIPIRQKLNRCLRMLSGLRKSFSQQYSIISGQDTGHHKP